MEMAELVSVIPDIEFFADGGWFEQIIGEGCVETASRMLASTGIVKRHALWANAINKDKSLAPRVSAAMREFIKEIDVGCSDPLEAMFPDVCLDAVTKDMTADVPDVEMGDEPGIHSTPFFRFACNASTSALLIAGELLSMVDKGAVLDRLVHTPIATLDTLPQHLDAESFHALLYKEYNATAWYSILASILNVEELTEGEMRQMADTNLLAFLVVGLAQSCSAGLARNLLEQFLRCLEWCHVRERNELSLLLHSLLLTPTVTRLQCMFVAHSIHVIMQPSHPLFHSLTEYLLAIPVLPALPFLEEALMLSYLPSLLKHDDMQRDILFCAGLYQTRIRCHGSAG